jgi:hypothetical protein
MARITVNTTGTQPTLILSTTTSNVTANTFTANTALSVTCLQDVTITNSTGIFSWTDFCSLDTNKVTTPADNEITTNLVIDSVAFFGNANATPNTAATFSGVNGLSQNKIPVSFKLIMNGDTTANTGAFYYQGTGYVSSLAPTVSPEAPVWVTPLTIAVDGSFSYGTV